MPDEPATTTSGASVEGGDSAVETIEWTYRVPLLTSRFMLWDFVRVTALSVLAMYALVALTGLLVEGEAAWLPPQVALLTGGVLLALFVVASLLLGNRFTMTFTVKPEGVTYASGSRERKWNRAAVLFGLLGGNATTTGAGLIAASGEQGGWEWSDLHSARYFPDQRVISLRNSWRTVLRLHTTAEGYHAVRHAVARGLERGAAERAGAGLTAPGHAVRRPWRSYAGAALLPVLGAVLVAAWPWLQYEEGMRVVIVSVLLLWVAGFTGGCVRRVAAMLSLAPTGYVVYLTAVEMAAASSGWMPGQTAYGWEYDTGLLAVTLVGEAVLVGLAVQWSYVRGRRTGSEVQA